MNRQGDPSGEEIAASQQTGEELPRGIRGPIGTGEDMDAPSRTGALDHDDPDPLNSAAGFSMGGTGAGIEPGVDAALGFRADPEEVAAEVYGEPRADQDFDPDADELGMGQDEV